ncbi:TatD family hydrolase [Mongoliitalea daihaiensis]|uniref:TatD family hydrolase n=1 Tax=Mongoliitalea daihaiensis TaxID=2782006 RepID=UPI001F409335|nr:TatD family hydrolase [Mongoliitalea daihaiensis]UJP65176.1 TatD family hydrolase [Mongoliitalea daihaiensis]
MAYIDSHVHIYSSKYEEDRSTVIQSAFEQGVTKLYMPNIDIPSIDMMLDAELRYPDICIPMMGLHPCDVTKDFEKDLYIMEDWISKRDFAAIGETGLDLYWDKTFFEQQKVALRIQIQWAKAKGWPIVLHCRESMEEVLQIIREEQDGSLKGIFHCFSGTLEQAKEVVKLGFLLGIGGVATFKNGGLQPILSVIGLEHLVLETDGPYLAPTPHRGKRNTPEFIPLIAQVVADILAKSLDEVASITTKNSLKIFHPTS